MQRPSVSILDPFLGAMIPLFAQGRSLYMAGGVHIVV